MSKKHDADHNAEEALLTLEQLSETLEVLTCVVNRLKHQLNYSAQADDSLDPLEEALLDDLTLELHSEQGQGQGQESTVLEISGPEEGDPILH